MTLIKLLEFLILLLHVASKSIILYLFWKLFFEIRIAAKVVKLSYAGMLVVHRDDSPRGG